jgi:hypothetical protein
MIAKLKRREFLLLGGGAAAWPLAARAQQAGKLPTFGILGTAALIWHPWMTSFVGRLLELGWIEGRTVAIECWSQGRPARPAVDRTRFLTECIFGQPQAKVPVTKYQWIQKLTTGVRKWNHANTPHGRLA